MLFNTNRLMPATKPDGKQKIFRGNHDQVKMSLLESVPPAAGTCRQDGPSPTTIHPMNDRLTRYQHKKSPAETWISAGDEYDCNAPDSLPDRGSIRRQHGEGRYLTSSAAQTHSLRVDS